MKHLKYILIIPVFLIMTALAFAQPENVVRMGLSSFAAGHFNLAYERVLGERTSANLQLGYVYGFGDAITSRLELPDFDINPFKGVVIHPEFRFYSAKHGAPKGFYFAPYFRYSNLNASAVYTHDPDPLIAPNVFSTNIQYSHIGLGMQLGTQFMIKDMVAIDFFWMGPRLYAQNTYTLTLNGNPDPSGTSGVTMADLASDIDIESSVGDIPVVGNLIEVQQTSSANELELRVKHPVFLLPWRFGISIGYAF